VSQEFLTQLDLARRWRMSPRTLERWRWLRRGPPYIRIAHVLYRLTDVEAYEAQNLCATDLERRDVQELSQGSDR